MPTWRDPRLTSPLLLAIAGRRLQHRQAQPQFPVWEKVEGISQVLDYARRQPQHDLDDLSGVYEGAPGLGGLLWEARQQVQEGEA